VETRVQKEGTRQQISFPIFILYDPIFAYTQGIVHHQNKYLLGLGGVTVLHVGKSFIRLKIILIA
jgi:hypothetical protein